MEKECYSCNSCYRQSYAKTGKCRPVPPDTLRYIYSVVEQGVCEAVIDTLKQGDYLVGRGWLVADTKINPSQTLVDNFYRDGIGRTVRLFETTGTEILINPKLRR